MTRVLVVDDEPQIRRALRTSLEAHGYDVQTASQLNIVFGTIAQNLANLRISK